MKLAQESDRETYRLIVPSLDGMELLLVHANTRFLLPSVEILHSQRVAESLTAAMKREWGHEVICLFAPDIAVPSGQPNGIRYQVVECRDRAMRVDARTQWVPISLLSQESFADSSDYLVVQRSLAECDAGARGLAPGPFATLGWFQQLYQWVEEAIQPLNLQLSGCFRQFNASPSFSLIRFETNGPALWFKAVGKPNLREFPVMLTLVQLFPKFVPPLLAKRPSWNGWLSPEIEGTNLGQTRNIAQWEAAIVALARLQLASVGRQAELLDAGARDLRTSTLSNLVSPFLRAMGQLMEQQTNIPPPVLNQEELLLLGGQIQYALSVIEDLGIPETLGHLDPNPGNIIVSSDGCRFLDWAEAYVGYPLFSFEYLLEHLRRAVGTSTEVESQLTASYLEQWTRRLTPRQIREAVAVAPLLAAFAYAAGSDRWFDQERLRDDPITTGYLRSLTRRMSCEGKRLINWRTRCLA
jgi:hypothetical protein